MRCLEETSLECRSLYRAPSPHDSSAIPVRVAAAAL